MANDLEDGEIHEEGSRETVGAKTEQSNRRNSKTQSPNHTPLASPTSSRSRRTKTPPSLDREESVPLVITPLSSTAATPASDHPMTDSTVVEDTNAASVENETASDVVADDTSEPCT